LARRDRAVDVGLRRVRKNRWLAHGFCRWAQRSTAQPSGRRKKLRKLRLASFVASAKSSGTP
jgi:hypothetical protein